MRPRIVVTDNWQGIVRFSADWTEVEACAEITVFQDAFPDEDAAAAALARIDIIMSMREHTPFPASLIARLPRLRMLSVTGSRNRSVDRAALAARGIVVTRTDAGKDGSATAELALALILAAARKVAAGDAAICAGGFKGPILPGFALRGKTLGLIGLGWLGTLMAGYAQALGMQPLAWSTNLRPARAAAAGATLATKDELLGATDVVSLLIVLAQGTVGLIGARELGLMRPGAILVSTSRGPLVEEGAVPDALATRRIVAALDVYDQEPLPADHPLRTAPNPVLTPHLGYCVQENFGMLYRQSIENVLAFLSGAPSRLLTA